MKTSRAELRDEVERLRDEAHHERWQTAKRSVELRSYGEFKAYCTVLDLLDDRAERKKASDQ